MLQLTLPDGRSAIAAFDEWDVEFGVISKCRIKWAVDRGQLKAFSNRLNERFQPRDWNKEILP
jgi:hypothetical protein